MGKSQSIYATSGFWVGVVERAVKTGAQAGLAFLATAGAGVLDWDWVALASVTAAAVVLSILTSLADPTRASLDNTTTLIEAPVETSPHGVPTVTPRAPVTGGGGRHAAS